MEEKDSISKGLEEEAKDKLFDSSKLKPNLFFSATQGIAQEELIKHQKFTVLENLILHQANREREESLNGQDFLEKEELMSQDLPLSEEERFEFLEKIPTQDFSKEEGLEEKSTEFPLEELTFNSNSLLSNNKERSRIGELNQIEGSEPLVEFTDVEKITSDQLFRIEKKSANIEKHTEVGELINAVETILLEEQPILIQDIVMYHERMRILLRTQKEELIHLKKKWMITPSQPIEPIVEEKLDLEATTLESIPQKPLARAIEPVSTTMMEFSSSLEPAAIPTLSLQIEEVTGMADSVAFVKEERSDINQRKFLMDHPLIPETWIQKATKVKITGQKSGEYFVLPYSGELEPYTHQKPKSLLMIISGSKKKISIPVGVAEDLIFVPQSAFMDYQDELQNASSVELKKKGLFATLVGKLKG